MTKVQPSRVALLFLVALFSFSKSRAANKVNNLFPESLAVWSKLAEKGKLSLLITHLELYESVSNLSPLEKIRFYLIKAQTLIEIQKRTEAIYALAVATRNYESLKSELTAISRKQIESSIDLVNFDLHELGDNRK